MGRALAIHEPTPREEREHVMPRRQNLALKRRPAPYVNAD